MLFIKYFAFFFPVPLTSLNVFTRLSMMKKQFTRSNMIDILQFNFVSLFCVCVCVLACTNTCIYVWVCVKGFDV